MKICFIDTETTGLSLSKNEVIEVSLVVRAFGKERAKTFFFRPKKLSTIDTEALKLQGKSIKEVIDYPPGGKSLSEMIAFLAEDVDRYNKFDKYIPAGYNVRFDIDFVRQLFEAHGDKYYGSWFYSNFYLDVYQMVCLHRYNELMNVHFPSMKLEYIYRAFIDEKGPEGEAHDSAVDLDMTVKLFDAFHNYRNPLQHSKALNKNDVMIELKAEDKVRNFLSKNTTI